MSKHAVSSAGAPGKIVRPIGYRLALASLLVGLVCALVITALQVQSRYLEGRNELLQQFDELERTRLGSLQEALWHVDLRSAETQIAGIAAMDGVAEAVLTTTQGERIARGQLEQPALAERQFQLNQKIERGGQTEQIALGVLQVKLSDKELLARLYQESLRILLSVSLVLAATSIILNLLFRRWVTRHLQRMADYARTMNLAAVERPLVLQRSGQGDELAAVVQAINQMRERLGELLQVEREQARQLAGHRDQLEQQVEQRTAELQQQSQQLARQADELRGQNRDLESYAHTVAHDLKIPLTTVIGLAGLLREMRQSMPEQQVADALTTIHRTSLKMAQIIDALLTLASLRSDRPLAPQLLHSRQIVDECINRLQPMIEQSGAELEVAKHWPAALGRADWVEAVWTNYLSNAIKYGGMPAKIELGATRQDDGQIRFYVRDHGPGIEHQDYARLFQPFSRLQPGTVEGHGIGLSIVARIIAKLDGQVGAEPAPGGGSLFWFSLPAEG